MPKVPTADAGRRMCAESGDTAMISMRDIDSRKWAERRLLNSDGTELPWLSATVLQE